MMISRLAFPLPLTTSTSVLAAVVSDNPLLSEILAYVRALDSAIAETTAELAALRAQKWTAPTFEVVVSLPVNCKHGLREDWCAACIRLAQSGKSRQRASHVRRFRTMVTVWVGVKDGNDISKKPITRTVDGFEDFSGYFWQNRTGEEVCTPIDDLNCLRHAEPRFNQVTPEDVACGLWKHVVGIEASQFAVIREFTEPLTDWCPICKEYMNGNHDAKGLACKKHVEKQAAKAAKTLEGYCAKWKATWQRGPKVQPTKLPWSQRSPHARLFYSPEEFDREILVSRGSVTGEAVKQFDKDHSRKGNKYLIS